MNRRGFLKMMGVGIAAAAAPEILVPEKKFWQLDRTMVSAAEPSITLFSDPTSPLPRGSMPVYNYPQNFDVGTFYRSEPLSDQDKRRMAISWGMNVHG